MMRAALRALNDRGRWSVSETCQMSFRDGAFFIEDYSPEAGLSNARSVSREEALAMLRQMRTARLKPPSPSPLAAPLAWLKEQLTSSGDMEDDDAAANILSRRRIEYAGLLTPIERIEYMARMLGLVL